MSVGKNPCQVSLQHSLTQWLWQHVLPFLDSPQLITLMSLSRAFYRLAQHQRYWTALFVLRSPGTTFTMNKYKDLTISHKRAKANASRSSYTMLASLLFFMVVVWGFIALLVHYQYNVLINSKQTEAQFHINHAGGIQYRYQIDGKVYESTRVYWMANVIKEAHHMSLLPSDGQAVFYRENDPAYSFLFPQIFMLPYIVGISLFIGQHILMFLLNYRHLGSFPTVIGRLEVHREHVLPSKWAFPVLNMSSLSDWSMCIINLTSALSCCVVPLMLFLHLVILNNLVDESIPSIHKTTVPITEFGLFCGVFVLVSIVYVIYVIRLASQLRAVECKVYLSDHPCIYRGKHDKIIIQYSMRRSSRIDCIVVNLILVEVSLAPTNEVIEQILFEQIRTYQEDSLYHVDNKVIAEMDILLSTDLSDSTSDSSAFPRYVWYVETTSASNDIVFKTHTHVVTVF